MKKGCALINVSLLWGDICFDTQGSITLSAGEMERLSGESCLNFRTRCYAEEVKVCNKGFKFCGHEGVVLLFRAQFHIVFQGGLCNG